MSYETEVKIPYQIPPSAIQRTAMCDAHLRDSSVPFEVIQHVYDLENRLSQSLWELTQADQTLRDAKARHRLDVDTISDALIEEAEGRDWCSMYDDFVNRVNESLEHKLQTREHDFEVTIEVTAKLTRVITATSSSQAIEDAEELLGYVDGYDIRGFDVVDFTINDKWADNS